MNQIRGEGEFQDPQEKSLVNKMDDAKTAACLSDVYISGVEPTADYPKSGPVDSKI